MDDAPLAYWRLSEPTDSIVAWDLTNNSNNALMVGGVTPQVAAPSWVTWTPP